MSREGQYYLTRKGLDLYKQVEREVQELDVSLWDQTKGKSLDLPYLEPYKESLTTKHGILESIKSGEGGLEFGDFGEAYLRELVTGGYVSFILFDREIR